MKRRLSDPSMSQADLAEMLGVTQATVSRWEGGLIEPTLKHRLEIADALGVSADALFAMPVAA